MGKDKHFFDKMTQCPKCGKWSKNSYVKQYGSCLCGEILDEQAKFKYDMYVKLHLWRNKNHTKNDIERGKYV